MPNDASHQDPHVLSRRNMLLAGTALAASGLSGGAGLLRRQPATRTGTAPDGTWRSKPNILVIFGDDIGTANIAPIPTA